MSEYKILVVEDELLVSADIEESLEILGYKVIGSVATGLAAIESVSKQLPDIILMDIMLKGNMTGIEAANTIRQKHDVPIIFLTANADLATIEKAKVSLPYGYIIKPFTDKDLQTNIEIARFKFMNDIKTKMESDQYNQFFAQPKQGLSNQLILDGEKGLEKINLNDLYFIEGDEAHTTLHLFDEVITTSKSLNEIEKLLPPDQFCRVNCNTIIKTEKIFLVTFPEIIIADKMNVIVADFDKKELLESMVKVN